MMLGTVNMSGLSVPGPQSPSPHLSDGKSAPLDCLIPAARRYDVAMFSLPSENTAIVGAASISFLTNPSNGAVASCTVTTSNTARSAHGWAPHRL